MESNVKQLVSIVNVHLRKLQQLQMLPCAMISRPNCNGAESVVAEYQIA